MGYVYRYEIFLSWEAINIFRIEKTKVVNGCDCWGRPEYDDVHNFIERVRMSESDYLTMKEQSNKFEKYDVIL